MTWRYDFHMILYSGYFMRVRIIGLLLGISIPLQAASDFEEEQIQQRISPVGSVRIIEPLVNKTQPLSKPKENIVQQRSGKSIYEQYCVVCHFGK